MTDSKGRMGGPNRLWYYRKRMGLTQRQAAEIIGNLGIVDLSHLEHGHRIPSFATALKLELLYRTPVSYLFPEFYGALKRTLRKREDTLRARWGGRQPLDLDW